MDREKMNKSVLLLMVLFISALFLSMIRHFLMAILLAGIFSAMFYPLYQGLNRWLKGRRSLASLITLMIVVVLVLLPMTGLLGVVTAQAIKVGQSITPWVQSRIADPGALSEFTDVIPFYDKIEPYQELIYRKAGEVVGTVSKYLVNSLSVLTIGTVNFLFMVFVLIYCMFFFLMDGDKLLEKILYYLPMEDEDETLLLEKFSSVTNATLKGTAIIGILQGSLAGFAFFSVGIPSAVFWGTMMSVLSIIPSIGSALVWAPAVIILAVGGHYLKAAGLLLFCGLIVGSLDNFLRPRLVGKDTQMHELLIFFGTLGGIAMFGIIGFIIGPIIAALFVTMWEIYGVAFEDVLPRVSIINRDSQNEDAE
jgi:predicted PurR-regulated permease PerM